MKIVHVALACTGSMVLLALGLAQGQNREEEEGQNQEDCLRVRFSQDIIERFPNARESCRDVITRDGQDYAVFRVWVDRVSGNTLSIRFNNPDGSRGPSTRVTPAPDFRVLVDGKPTRVRDLAPRQELTAYVQVDRPMVALAPASESQPLQMVPFVVIRVAQREEPSMPNTAGSAPLIGAAGLLLVASAFCLRAFRRKGNGIRQTGSDSPGGANDIRGR